MKTGEARQRLGTRHSYFILFAVAIIVAAVVAVPVYTVRSRSLSTTGNSQVSLVPAKSNVSSRTASDLKTLASWSTYRSALPIPQSSPETIVTLAQDCATPKTTFVLGETVCAKTDSVSPLDGSWWVNWILLGDTPTVVNGGDGVNPVTTNPQFFSYTPTATGSYKVSLSNVPGDPSQTPAGFTVINQTAPIATYASNCTTLKSSFNLGETVCVRVQGLSNDEFPLRRVQLSGPDGFALQKYNVTDNSQQFTYMLPSATTETIDGQIIEHRGTWTVATIDPDANLRDAVKISVHKSNLLVDRVADLQVSKVLIPAPDPPTAGQNLSFQLFIFNQGPDPATNPRLFDVTLPNTTFVSFIRNTVVASNMGSYSGFGSFLGDDLSVNTDFVRFVRDSGSSALSTNTLPRTSFLSFMEESPLTFNCVPPSVGTAGTTTCTTTGELAPGESANFTAVYKVNTNVANGADLNDSNSATVGSDTVDQFTASNSQPAAVTTANPNPPACTITCPDNMTVGTNATDGQGHPGAIVSFGPEALGICGVGITSIPASGSFFPVGPNMVTSTTGSGASCNFNITVVNTPQPTISCAANQSAVAPSGQSEVAVAVPTPTFTGSFLQNQVPDPLTGTRSDQRDLSETYSLGTTTITWRVTDQYGTTKSCNQKVTVTSADAPTISCPSDKTFAADSGDCQKTLTAPDIGTPTVGGFNTTYSSARSDNLSLTAAYPAGQTSITWTATNALGSASCTQVITITTTGDSTPPTLTIPADINISTSDCSVVLDDELGIASATDNCTPSVKISRVGVPLIACPNPLHPDSVCPIDCSTQFGPGVTCVESFIFPTGSTDIVYTATDASGNSVSKTQHINIAENPVIFPTITAPVSLTGANSIPTGPGATSCGTFVGDATLGSATASDNCPGVTVTRTGVPAGNIFPVGDTDIVYTATDRTNHSTSATQRVTVVDNTPPIVTAPGAVTLYTGPDATSCGVTVADLNATMGTGSATDNCGVGAVTRSGVPSGNTFQVGTIYTLTYSATDVNGNSASATQVVTVVDNTPPVITTNGQTPSMWPPNHKYQTFNVTSFVTSVFDNCGGVSVSNVVIDHVTSDETENGNGDGNTLNDIVIASNCRSVQLRSERDGGGNGRVYTITFRLTDTHGNTTTKTAKVVVPHNPGETPVDSGVHYTVSSNNCP